MTACLIKLPKSNRGDIMSYTCGERQNQYILATDFVSFEAFYRIGNR